MGGGMGHAIYGEILCERMGCRAAYLAGLRLRGRLQPQLVARRLSYRFDPKFDAGALLLRP